ncbi:MAG: hypothetical protein QOD29_4877 [Alphaproteobacteria bacterium]|jgi:hypothetical protein|nr:hypothetical protein [Alphaproteobacteria bacterium]
MVLRCESLEPLMSQLGQNRLTPLVRLGLLLPAADIRSAQRASERP